MISARLLLYSLVSIYVFTSMACADKERRPDRYLIPDGYVGWVRINYEVDAAPALPLEDGYNLIKISPDGLLNTSSGIEEGWATDEYFYYSGDKRQKLPHTVNKDMIFGHIIGKKSVGGQKPTRYEEFFVGTKEQYEKYGVKNKDADGDTIIGPIKE